MQDYRQLLRSTSRTFAVGIEALPRELREGVTLAYLVLRVSDYFEDSPTLPPEIKERCLREWGELLESAREPIAPGICAPLLDRIREEDRELPDALAAQEAEGILAGLAALPHHLRDPIRRHTAETTFGMARWVERGDDFPDVAALDEYMFEVAGRVGLLLTDLFSAWSPRIREASEPLYASAVSFGLGLQTVNVIRGLHEDPERGWNFVPRTVLPTVDRTKDVRSLDPGAQQVILDFLIGKAARHISDALCYCQALPRRARGIRIFCIIPALLALRTAEISRQVGTGVFHNPVKIGRREVGRIVLLSRLAFFSNGWLEKERARAAMLGDSSSSLPSASL
jgi:farnesyl-diphosphate farnesyltransferase